jgi:hypothetical protein
MTLRIAMVAAAMLIATGVAFPTFAASATNQASKNVWSAMDKCSKTAREMYPDGTAASLAKRDAYTHACQRDNRVPVREGQSPKK